MELSPNWQQYFEALERYQNGKLEPHPRTFKPRESSRNRIVESINDYRSNVVDDKGVVIFRPSDSSYCHVQGIFQRNEILTPEQAFKQLELKVPEILTGMEVQIQRDTLSGMPRDLAILQWTPYSDDRERLLSRYLKDHEAPEWFWALYLTNRNNLPKLKK